MTGTTGTWSARCAKLLNQVGEAPQSAATATVNELVDRWLDVLEVERTTRMGYIGKISISAAITHDQ